MNHEGYRDDTPEKAIWGIRKEERIKESFQWDEFFKKRKMR